MLILLTSPKSSLPDTTLPARNFPLETEQAAPEYQGGLFYIRLEQVSV